MQFTKESADMKSKMLLFPLSKFLCLLFRLVYHSIQILSEL